MKIKYIIFILLLSGFIFLQDSADTLIVKHDSKAPLIISTLPFLNNDPAVMFALSTLLLAINSKDTLSKNYPDPNTAMFLSSIPLLNMISENEMLYIPAFGQIYNRKPLKAFIMMAMKSYWLSEYKSSKNDDIKDRNRSLWWLLILILYGMADAYVDAHLDKDIDTINKKIENSYNGDTQ